MYYWLGFENMPVMLNVDKLYIEVVAALYANISYRLGCTFSPSDFVGQMFPTTVLTFRCT